MRYVPRFRIPRVPISTTRSKLFSFSGLIDYELDYVIPKAMDEKLKNVTQKDEILRELDETEFKASFLIMSEVLTHHLQWIMTATASRLGA